MITNVWLKSQLGKKIPYPDCWPSMLHSLRDIVIYNKEHKAEANYSMELISRIEFRP